MPKPKSEVKHFEVKNQNQVAKINIVGEIGWWRTSGERFQRLVDELLEAGIQDVEGYINTPGGGMFDANEIGNQVSRFPGKKSCKLGSMCASAGTTLSTYFDHDKITASSNTQYMIHDPIMSPRITRVQDFESNKALYLNLRNGALDRYEGVTKSNQGDKAPIRKKIDSMMESVTWMNAKQAQEKGFVTNVAKEKDENMPADAQAVLNNLYDALNEQSEETMNFVIPETVNSLLKPPVVKEEPLASKPPNTDLNISDDDTMNDVLKNQLIVAFCLTTVTKSSTDEDIINAVIASFNGQESKMQALIDKVGITAEAGESQEALLIKMSAALKKKDDKITNMENAIKADNQKKFDALVKIAKSQGKINDKSEASLKEMYDTSGLEAVSNFLETLPVRKSLASQIEDPANDGGSGAAVVDGQIQKAESMSQMVYMRMAAMDQQDA